MFAQFTARRCNENVIKSAVTPFISKYVGFIRFARRDPCVGFGSRQIESAEIKLLNNIYSP